MEELICFTGYFDHLIFQSDDNYTVIEFTSDDKSETYLIVVGYLASIDEDSRYRIYGKFVEHHKYGQQFSLSSYEKLLPNDEESLISYFASSAFKGIGKKAAMKIVKILGSEAISLIKDDHEIVKQLGLTSKQEASLLEGINTEVNDSILFFTQNGLSNKTISKISAVYEDKAIEIVKDNPYQMINDIDGIGFKTADKLAMVLGFEKNDPKRMKAAITSCVLNECMKSGDTYTTIKKVKRVMKKEFNFSDEKLFDDYLKDLVREQQVYLNNDEIYHKSQYEAEQGIADYFKYFELKLNNQDEHSYLNEKISDLELRFNIEYESSQKQAINTFFNESFSILTGGPGTGKTTIVKAIIELYRNYHPYSKLAICAPTGRASKRLSQLSEYPATTIHSLLKWDLESNTFGVNEDEPIDSELLIVDECSMVDAYLFYHLLQASKNVKKILLIGDEDQLPSVGPGFVLRDLIASNLFPLTRLEKIYRQSEGSDVITLAHQIKNGNVDILENGQDVKMFHCLNYEVKDMIVDIVKNAFEKGFNDLDVQVLVPMYKGVAGINEINNTLQELINPLTTQKQIRVNSKILRENDKILQLKNQPDDNVYNGDIGRIVDISYASENLDNENLVTCEFEDHVKVVYNSETLINITHAYCISIHKSQGSEYPIVIMPILKDYVYMLKKRLIYTGVSRARKSLVLLGSKEELIKGINRVDSDTRHTHLKDKILANYHQNN